MILSAVNRLLVASGIGAITVYRYTLSAVMGRTCRHMPSCSEYGIIALRRHGAWRGGWLLLARLVRCRPGGSHGFDPVPETLEQAGWRSWRYGNWRSGELGGEENGGCEAHLHATGGKIGRQG